MPQKLGQHFLINKQKLRKIAESLDLKDDDTVIEIGPGHGELTKELKIQNSKCKIVCIEKDPELAFRVEGLGFNNLEIIKGNALKVLPEIAKRYSLNAKPFKLVGNIPYYITGHLFRIIGELKNKPSLIVFTIQKEVAERVCSKPPEMNLLAASVQFWAKPEIIGYIPKSDFRPAPKVDSAIIKLTLNPPTLNTERYYRFIKTIFKQPRKTILNNLVSNIKNKEEIIKKLGKVGVNPNARPQNLKMEQLYRLSTLF